MCRFDAVLVSGWPLLCRRLWFACANYFVRVARRWAQNALCMKTAANKGAADIRCRGEEAILGLGGVACPPATFHRPTCPHFCLHLPTPPPPPALQVPPYRCRAAHHTLPATAPCPAGRIPPPPPPPTVSACYARLFPATAIAPASLCICMLSHRAAQRLYRTPYG